ncbi:MAG: hypothetical protein PHT78_04215 [Desulfitobacteriaceae bacterium]|nr:hypothetical protein [Desulfitobacteriaceae bacterium]MDD4752450.1 hypothetical protein [Desulfitobacteriaceae bacterium]
MPNAVRGLRNCNNGVFDDIVDLIIILIVLEFLCCAVFLIKGQGVSFNPSLFACQKKYQPLQLRGMEKLSHPLFLLEAVNL